MATKKLKISQRTIIAIAGILIATAGIAGVLWSIVRDSGGKDGDVADFSEVVDDIQVTASTYLNEGRVEEGLRYYDDQIDKYGDNEKKTLLVFKSNLAMSGERFDEAISFAKQADDMGSDIATTRAIAQAYRAKGDNKQAVVYYKKLLELRQSEEGESDPYMLAEGREATLGSIIKELE